MPSVRRSVPGIFAVLLMSFILSCLRPPGVLLAAQESGGKREDTARKHGGKDEKEKKKFPDFSSVVEDAKKFPGFFNLWQKGDRLYCEIKQSEFGKPFLLMMSVARGTVGPLVGGTTLSEWLLEWRKLPYDDEHVQLVRKNTRYRARRGTPTGRAVEMSYTDSVLRTFKVETRTPGGGVLIDLSGLLLSDFAGISSYLSMVTGGPARFVRGKSFYYSIKNFPRNVEVRVGAVFDLQGSSKTVIYPHGCELVMHYSLCRLPAKGFKPRRADDRIGFFTIAVKDFSDEKADENAVVRFITRWRLEKADPQAAMSVPKKPIVFYLEKSIPYRYRHYLREGILEWNKAFRKIGFADAIEVRVQGEEDTWDPEDARYNTIRWITSPYTFAIGPTRIDPRTGEILDADILIDAGWVRIGRREFELHLSRPESSSERGEEPIDDILEELEGRPAPSQFFSHVRPYASCDLFKGMTLQLQMGMMALARRSAAGGKEGSGRNEKAEKARMERFIGEYLKSIVMHEVGHTLGLRHNFRASTWRSLEELQDASLTRKEGLLSSVMDYPALNVMPSSWKQGEYFPSTIGPWDYLQIEYGYKEIPPAKEDSELKKIAAKTWRPEYVYGTDEDTFGDRCVDPRDQRYDLGKDQLEWLKTRITLVRELLEGYPDWYVKKGEQWYKAREGLKAMFFSILEAEIPVIRYVGGLWTSRAHKDDDVEPETAGAEDGGKKEKDEKKEKAAKTRKPSESRIEPCVPIDPATQRKALELLCEKFLAGAPMRASAGQLRKLGPQWWMDWCTEEWFMTEFPYLQYMWAMQRYTLRRLLSPDRLLRVMNNSLMTKEGNPLTVEEILNDTTKAIWWSGDRKRPWKNWDVLKRELQRTHVKLLGDLVLGGFNLSGDISAQAVTQLHRLRVRLDKLAEKGELKKDPVLSAHLRDIIHRIDTIMEARCEVRN